MTQKWCGEYGGGEGDRMEKKKYLYHIADLSVSVAFRKTPPHHICHMEGFDSQQVEDHSVGESELRVEDGWFTLNQIKRRKSTIKMLHINVPIYN